MKRHLLALVTLLAAEPPRRARIRSARRPVEPPELLSAASRHRYRGTTDRRRARSRSEGRVQGCAEPAYGARGEPRRKAQSRGTRDGVFQHPDWARGFLTGDRFEVPRHPGRDREPSHSNRVGAMWYIHQVLDNGESESSALEEAKKAGLRSEALEGRAKDYVAQNKPE